MHIDERLVPALKTRLKGAKQLQKLFKFLLDDLEELPEGICRTREFTDWEILQLVSPKKYEEACRKQLDGDEPAVDEKSPKPANGRNAIRRLRDLLERFSVSPTGRKLSVRASIPSDSFRLEIVPDSPNLKKFWAPYIRLEDRDQAPVRIMYTEHLFYYHPQKRYVVRHLEANDSGEDIRQYLPFIPVEHGALTPAWHFVNASDVHAVLQFSNVFNMLSIPLEFRDARAGNEPQHLAPLDLVILGSPRTSQLIQTLQEELNLNFQLSSASYSITNRSPIKREESSYTSEPRSKDKIFGIVARGKSKTLKDAWVTLIVSTHGRFLAAMSNQLQDEGFLHAMATRLGVNEGSAYPQQFEVLLELDKAKTNNNPMVGQSAAIIAVRPDPDAASDKT